MGKKIARVITTRPIERPGGTIRFTEESFQEVLDTINGGRAVRQGVNHDPTYPPSGKNTSAWTVAEDGFTSLYAEIDDTHVVKRTKFQGHRQNFLTMTFPNDDRPFVLEGSPEDGRLSVSTDPANFDSFKQQEEFRQWIAEYDDTIDTRIGGRFSEIPEALIHFFVEHREALSLIGLWAAGKAWKFVDHTIDATIKDLADRTGSTLSQQIAGITKRFCGYQPRTERTATQHITLKTDPEINLITRSNDLTQNLELDPAQIQYALEKCKEILKVADSITLYRENQKQDWKFRYATTRDGKVITTKAAYRESVRELERITRSRPICICMKNRATGEEFHYETAAEFQPISRDDGEANFRVHFSKPPQLEDENWEVTAIVLDPRGSSDPCEEPPPNKGTSDDSSN
jgi:hypothetical protein